MDDQGFDSRQRPGIFLFSKASRPALRFPSLAHNEYRGSFPKVKWRERETESSSPPSVKVKSRWSYTSTPPIRLQEKLVAHLNALEELERTSLFFNLLRLGGIYLYHVR
jgi:hypothetical protein